MNFAETFYYSNFEKDFRNVTRKYGSIDYFETNYDKCNMTEVSEEDDMVIYEEEEDDEFFNINDKNKKISRDKIQELKKKYNFYYLIQLNRETYIPEEKYNFKVIFFDRKICDQIGEIFDYQPLNESSYYSFDVDYLFHGINDLKMGYLKEKFNNSRVKLFLDYCLELFNKKIEIMEKCISESEIEFSHLWYYFDKPNCYYKIDFYGKPVIFKHKHFDYDEDCNKVPNFHMNGEVFLMKNNNVTLHRFIYKIPKFNGKRKLSSFKINLINVDLLDEFSSRGDKVLKYSQNIHYVKIKGKQFNFPDNKIIEVTRNEKAMVDQDFYFEKTKNNFREIGFIIDQVSEENLEKEKFLLFPFVGTFNLGMTKTWGMVYIDDIYSIEFNKNIFNQLVIDNDIKDIIKILVSRFDNDKFKDYVDNKGLGLLFLLHGPPGVGKTLTAEATSELLEKPLYIINVGDLDLDTEQLEFKLKEIEEYCSRWNSIFLFDEADIFLEERDLSNITRNSIVSTFLKFLEYNKTIIFLTTNRINCIDSAVRSRINLIIAYNNLNKEKRCKIWENILDFWSIQLSKRDVDKLSNFELNGREIRNYLKIVICIIKDKDIPIDYANINKYMNTLIDLGNEFNSKVKNLYN